MYEYVVHLSWTVSTDAIRKSEFKYIYKNICRIFGGDYGSADENQYEHELGK
jgi:hypothetical protein